MGLCSISIKQLPQNIPANWCGNFSGPSWSCPDTLYIYQNGNPISWVATYKSDEIGCNDNTIYQWKKNGIDIPNATTNKYTVVDTGLYTVSLGCCISSWGSTRVLWGSATGINENTNSRFLLYPNPASEKLTIQTNDLKNTTVSIYNTIGEIMLTKKIKDAKTEIDISILNNGIYFVSLKNETTIATEKIIKNNAQ